MEFGRVGERELDSIDFSLPAEPNFNKTILSGKKAKDAKVYLGCAKWGRTEWVGKILSAMNSSGVLFGFEEHLSPIFVQVSDAFSPKRKEELFDYMASLPKICNSFLEVRHPHWFAKEVIRTEMLMKLNGSQSIHPLCG